MLPVNARAYKNTLLTYEDFTSKVFVYGERATQTD
jgi:hypothetical protein